MKTFYLFLIVSFIFTSTAHAVSGKLIGRVVDQETGEELIGATIMVKETGQGAITDLNGHFQIPLTPGIYTLQISYVAYTPYKIENINLESGETVELNVKLASDTELEEIVIEAKAIKDNDVSMLKIQRKALGIQDGISSMQIKRMGASTAAESMTFVTGAAVEDGKYIVMRGLGDRYTLSLMNGMILPGADPYRNSMSMDLIPSEMIENITAIKTFLPDKPGNFTGGAVDITTKSIPADFYLSVSLNTAFNTASSMNNRFLSDGATVNRALAGADGNRNRPMIFDQYPFLLDKNQVDQTRGRAVLPGNSTEREILDGAATAFPNSFVPVTVKSYIDHGAKLAIGNQLDLFQKPFGYNIALNYSRKFINYESLSTGFYSPYDYDSLITEQDLNRTRNAEVIAYGGMLNLSYQVSPFNELGFMTLYNRSSETLADTAAGFWRNTSSDIYKSGKISFLDRTLWNNTLTGKHIIPQLNNLRLDWAAGYMSLTQDQPDFRAFGFVINNGTYVMNTSEVGRLPTHFYRNLQDDQYNAKLDITIPFNKSNPDDILKFGVSYSNKQREFSEFLYGHHREPATIQPGVNDDYVSFTSAQGDFDRYFAPANYGLVNGGLPGENTLTGRLEYGFGTLISNQSVKANSYQGKEIISAAYLMGAYNLGPSVKLIVGVRAESTDISTMSADTSKVFSGQTDEDGQPVLRSRNGRVSTVDFLPSVNAVWKVGKNSNLRFSFTQTISRPNMREISPFVSVGTPEDPQFLGNPDIRRTLITNYDLRYELFPDPGELIAVSLYYKDLDDPIVIQNLPQASTPEIKPVNTDRAQVYGAELEFRKNLGFITTGLRNFRLGLNLSLIHSRVDKDSVELVPIKGTGIQTWRPLQGQSPFILNVMLNHFSDALSWENTVTFNLYGARLSYVTDPLTPDVYQQPMPMLNFISTKHFGQHVQVTFTAKNILNSLIQQRYDTKRYNYLYESYRMGSLFELSLGFTL